MRLLTLLLKRLLVLLAGIYLACLTAFRFFPWFDKRLPLAVAVLVTYCCVAYLAMPALVRLWRILHQPTHVPTRSVEADGWAADPINIVMLAKNKAELVTAMQRAGWTVADAPSLRNITHMVLAIVLNRPYPAAPFETNYVFGRPQDLGFQIPVGTSPLKRHHVRFWQLGVTRLANEHEHHGFWRSLLVRFLTKKKQVWIGAAVYDTGITAKKRNLQSVHSVEGNTSIERDFLVQTLERADVLEEVSSVKAGEPVNIKHHRFGGLLITDGYVKLCRIRRLGPLEVPLRPPKSMFELQPDAQTFLQDLVYEIDHAKHSVAAQFYTFEADAAGLPVAEALLRAKKRGVHVRLMVDNSINFMHNDYYIHKLRFNRRLQASIVAEWRATQRLLDDLQRAGIDIKLLNPLGFLRRKIFVRAHNKLVAIDDDGKGGGISYIGGINPSEHNASWNDFMIKMRGTMTRLVSNELTDSWYGINRSHSVPFRGGKLVTDAHKQSLIIPTATKLIDQARKRVIIESPYPWGKHIIGALVAAAQRGVDVSVIVPLRNNWSLFVPNKRTLARMTAQGVHVYRFTENKGMTHAKALLADGTALFGSSNFNEFLAGRLTEACIMVDDRSLVAQLETLLVRDMAKSFKES